jgi:chromate reductase
MRVLGISGSLRHGSYNTALLREAAELVPAGVELELYEGLELLPPYNEDDDSEDGPVEGARLRAAIEDADALLVATPEYNGSIPGALKNALDWVSRPIAETPIRSKPVAVIGASTGAFGGVWAQRELKKVLGLMGARVLDLELAVAKADRALADPDTELRLQLAGVVSELVSVADLERLAA